MNTATSINNPIILFDGICNLCNSSVQFIIKHDKKKQFRFASLQSTFGQSVLKKYNLPDNDFTSFILLENENLYTRSTAALKIFKHLNGIWPFFYAFIVVPKNLRDWGYNIVAKNRYKWFGKQESCWVPTPELQSLFIS